MHMGPALRGTMTRLVPTSEGDVDLLAGWFADPDFVEHWGRVPVSREEVAAKYVGRRRPQVESFLVLAQGVPVGYAQYWYASAVEGGLDMVLVSWARGRGWGPDAAQALVRHVCGTLRWERVTVDPAATNVRAVRAWEKAGFHRVSSHGESLLLEYRPTGDADFPVPPQALG
ncbi:MULTISPECIES: GNAT family N-acetyltransferase [Streptomyces]|uniref:GNAT family N-acetyltransferase n=1 Tax=Streptomyces siderophoricus TaxID=2802281 RepID=A0ABS1MZI0_9ACTN|nr:GNAT family N-acetyltransferase [Streptomyces sp. 9-7]